MTSLSAHVASLPYPLSTILMTLSVAILSPDIFHLS